MTQKMKAGDWYNVRDTFGTLLQHYEDLSSARAYCRAHGAAYIDYGPRAREQWMADSGPSDTILRHWQEEAAAV